MAFVHEDLRVLLVEVQAPTLRVGPKRAANSRGAFVDFDAAPLETAQQILHRSRDEARLVRVFDAQNERALMPPRKQVVEQRGA